MAGGIGIGTVEKILQLVQEKYEKVNKSEMKLGRKEWSKQSHISTKTPRSKR